jgi:dinuclear metal center YbgI/SA1388 family protein
LLSLDVTECVIDEAIAQHCNLIIAHHPLIFSGLKKITGKNYVERSIIKAIKNDVTIYAAHTNLDNVQQGVNYKIAEKLGLIRTEILAPTKGNLCKFYTYVPAANAARLKMALFAAGLGQIGEYSECSFSTEGKGSFKPSENSHPTIGNAGGKREEIPEIKLEIIVPEHLQQIAISVLKENHPYEEVAYEMIRLENANQTLGAGVIGELKEAMPVSDFLKLLKTQMKTACIRHTQPHTSHIRKVALCGGSGSFLLPQAIARQADIFITADYKYHQFFDAEGKIMIADIGHYESEQFTIEIFRDILKEKFPNFAVLFTKEHTNPINYYL